MPRNLLQSAIRNNAEWCELVAVSHGVSNGWLDNAWRATGSMAVLSERGVTGSEHGAWEHIEVG